MNFNSLKKILLAIFLVSLTQTCAYSIDDVWGSSMGITEDAIKQNTTTNTIFDASDVPSLRTETSAPEVNPDVLPTPVISEH